MPFDQAERTIRMWAEHGLKNIRFSGGEPTMYKRIPELVSLANVLGAERIAISTNGASSMALYENLLSRGVTDFSVSLDACCSEDGDKMAGGRKGSFARVVNSIRELSKLTYVTVGVVLTSDNKDSAEDIIRFADSLGVSDIRVIPAAQYGKRLPALDLKETLLKKYPILRYRVENILNGKTVRGIDRDGTAKCGLVLDDMAVMGGKHYPCIIYLREGGKAIGEVGPNMRKEREGWYKNHNSFSDPICSKNCLDVCCDYNAAHDRFNTLT